MTACSRDFQKPDFAFALHSGGFPMAMCNYRAGVGSSNSDSLYIKFHGRGGHGAMPQMTIDPVMIAARFIVDVQTVVSREKDPTEFGVVTIGAIHGGTVGNIIPDEVMLLGTIRTFKPEVRAKLVAGIERMAKAAAEMSDAPEPEIRIAEGTKAVINDPAVVAHRRESAESGVRRQAEAVARQHAQRGFFGVRNAGVPSMLFNIGVYEPERSTAANRAEHHWRAITRPCSRPCRSRPLRPVLRR